MTARQLLISMKMCGKVSSRQLPSSPSASHSKWQPVCTGSVFSRWMSSSPQSPECVTFSHTMMPLWIWLRNVKYSYFSNICVFFKVHYLPLAPQTSQSIFLPLSLEKYIGGKGDYSSCSPPCFLTNPPLLPHDAGHWGDWVCHCKWFSLINGVFDWSNLTLPGMDRLCCFSINHNEKCLKK